jgi:ribonuclease-3
MLTLYSRRIIVYKEEEDLTVSDNKKLQKIMGVIFNQPALLEEALVHSSYINENPNNDISHNERLEFIGDAVLGFIIADKLYQELPDLSEGEMTKARATLVRGDALARIASDFKIGDFLYMGKGEEASGGRNKAPNLAGALEAVIAAIYLDQGMDKGKEVVGRLFAKEWEKLVSQGAGIDYKSKLQEFTQSKYQSAPVYRLITEEGPDHDKIFTVEVVVNGKGRGIGKGKSKKLAETEAARLALAELNADFTK